MFQHFFVCVRYFVFDQRALVASICEPQSKRSLIVPKAFTFEHVNEIYRTQKLDTRIQRTLFYRLIRHRSIDNKRNIANNRRELGQRSISHRCRFSFKHRLQIDLRNEHGLFKFIIRRDFLV